MSGRHCLKPGAGGIAALRVHSADGGGERAADARLSAPPVGHGGLAVVVVDVDGTVRSVSTDFEAVSGVDSGEVVGRNVRDLGNGGRDAALFAALADALRNGGVQGHRDAAIRKSRATEAVARLAGGLAHNFNNLLTAVLGYADLLHPLVGNDLKAATCVEEIQEAAERAAALTRQLLAFSREQAMIPMTFDLNALVLSLAREFRSRGTRGIDIRAELAADLWPVSVDPDQLEQALFMLAANARDAMPSGGRLIFATENVRFNAPMARRNVHVPPGSYAMLSVTDTGRGMDEETLDGIFEPFRTAGATGLAMAAVHGIVMQSGGYIWAFSRPGQGTTFEIYLPRAGGTRDAARGGRGESPQPPPAVRSEGESHVRIEESHAGPGDPVREREGP